MPSPVRLLPSSLAVFPHAHAHLQPPSPRLSGRPPVPPPPHEPAHPLSPVGASMPFLPRHVTPLAEEPMIVMFRASTDDLSTRRVCDLFRNDYAIHIQSMFRHCIKGFSAPVASTKLSALSSHPNVLRVERDFTVHTWTQIIPWGVKHITREHPAIRRGDEGKGRELHPSTTDLPVKGGINCDVYCIDTGIARHPDLNVVETRNFTLNELASDEDMCGHGTHTAGTIGAQSLRSGILGVAPGVRLHGMKALDQSGSGQMSWVIAAIDYISEAKLRAPSTPMVANLSLGFYSGQPGYNALDDAISRCVASGVSFVVAAGNDTVDAKLCSPAHVQGAITVGAYDRQTRFADFSNHGDMVDICAPGVDIYSTWLNKGYETLSGTSMAAPHVTGAVACFLHANPTAPPDVVKRAILQTAKNDVVLGVPGATCAASVCITPLLMTPTTPVYALPARPIPV